MLQISALKMTRLFVTTLMVSLQGSTATAAVASSSNTNNISLPLIQVGGGLCPNITVSNVCDPDHILSPDDSNNIQNLITEAYEGSRFACHETHHIRVQMGVYIRLHDRPHDAQDVAKMRVQWKIGEKTSCGNNGLLLYLTVSPDRKQAHVYLSPGDAMTSTLNRMVLQNVEDGMKPFLRHALYGEAIQAGILDLTAYVRGDKHFADLQQECLRDFYLSSWFFIFILYCCGGRLLLLVMHMQGRRDRDMETRARTQEVREEVEEKLQEIDDHFNHKYPHHEGDYISKCCPICLEPFPTNNNTKATTEPATEETPLVFQKNQMGSDGKALKSLPCGHVFDHTCIVDWMVTVRAKNRDALLSCPICMETF